MPGVALDETDGLLQVVLPVEILEHFAVAHRLEGWQVAVGNKLPGLFLQPFLHHMEHAGVYARV